MPRTARVPPMIEDVYRPSGPVLVRGAFYPGQGWVTLPGRRCVSERRVRRLRSDGAAVVILEVDGRLTDYTTHELMRDYRRARRSHAV